MVSTGMLGATVPCVTSVKHLLKDPHVVNKELRKQVTTASGDTAVAKLLDLLPESEDKRRRVAATTAVRDDHRDRLRSLLRRCEMST